MGSRHKHTNIHESNTPRPNGTNMGVDAQNNDVECAFCRVSKFNVVVSPARFDIPLITRDILQNLLSCECRIHPLHERLRGVITTRRYTNPRLPLPLPYQHINVGCDSQFTATLRVRCLTFSLLTCQVDSPVCFCTAIVILSVCTLQA